MLLFRGPVDEEPSVCIAADMIYKLLICLLAADMIYLPAAAPEGQYEELVGHDTIVPCDMSSALNSASLSAVECNSGFAMVVCVPVRIANYKYCPVMHSGLPSVRQAYLADEAVVVIPVPIPLGCCSTLVYARQCSFSCV